MKPVKINIGQYSTVEYSKRNDHIHGELSIEIGERKLPYLGFWGPEDVCFNDWFEELSSIVEQFEAKGKSTYEFEEGEQGQPVFQFKYDGRDEVMISIIKSEISGHPGDPEWQNIKFSFSDLIKELSEASTLFLDQIKDETPHLLKKWKKIVRITKT